MDEKLYELLDNELITYRELCVLEYKGTLTELAKELRISKQRLSVIKQKVTNRLNLPRCKDILQGRVRDKEPNYNLGGLGLPAGAVLKLYKYGVYDKRALKRLSIQELSSINGISITLAKNIFKKI